MDHQADPTKAVLDWCQTEEESKVAEEQFGLGSFIFASAPQEFYVAAFGACVDDADVLTTDLKATTERDLKRAEAAVDREIKVEPKAGPPRSRNRLLDLQKMLNEQDAADQKKNKADVVAQGDKDRRSTMQIPSGVSIPHAASGSKAKGKPKKRSADDAEGSSSKRTKKAT